MKKFRLLLLSGLLIAALAGCGNNAPAVSSAVPSETISGTPEPSAVIPTGTPDITTAPPSETTDGSPKIMFATIQGVYGFADASGKKLITLTDASPIEQPEAYNVAVGSNGDLIEITFVKQQEATAQDTGRQSMYNFDNMAGYVFEAKNGGLVQDKTYFLTSKTVFNKETLTALESTIDTTSEFGYYLKVDSETITRIEGLKNRKIVQSELISQAVDGAKICVFVFERIGDDMLASIAYIKGDTILFKDYPATYDASSTWRVDAGDTPGFFEVLYLAGSDQGLLLGMTWGAPEGELAFVLREEKGAFVETDLGSSRYWSPA